VTSGAAGGASLSTPLASGDVVTQAGHPAVAGVGREMYLIWKESDGEFSPIRTRHSTDSGVSWTAPRTLARTADA